MITVKEIAELAGVSRGTVDRALHGRGEVKAEVARQILDIAEKNGYVPDRAGRALSSRRNPVRIGVVFHAGENPFFKDVVNGLKQAESEFADYRLCLDIQESGGYDANRQAACIRSVAGAGARALIVTPVNDPVVAEVIDELAERDIPVICVNSDIPGSRRAAYVGCDYTQSGAVAAGLAGLMLRRQHTRACIVIGSLKILGHTQRVHGFARQCEENGIDISDVAENGDDDEVSYGLVTDMLREYSPDLLYFAAAGVAGGLEAVNKFCKDGKRPVIIACDETHAAVEALHKRTVQALITQQPFRQGYEAVKLAFDAAVNRRFPAEDKIYTSNEIKILQNITMRRD